MQVEVEAGRRNEKVGATRPKMVSKAWSAFAQKLAAALKNLNEDEYLILSKKRSNHYIQFACQGSYGVRAETTSNHYLDELKQLTQEETNALVDLGWLAPTSSPASSEGGDPDGSTNYYFDSEPPIDFLELAKMATDTLIKILSVSHPGFLQYNAFDSEGKPIDIPQLGMKRVASEKPVDDKKTVGQLLLSALEEITHIQGLKIDSDGDINGISYGEVSVHIRLLADEPYARFVSVLLKDIAETPELLLKLNDWNRVCGHWHLATKDGAVVLLGDALLQPFSHDHLARSLQEFCVAGEWLNDVLKAEYRATAIIDQNQSNLKH